MYKSLLVFVWLLLLPLGVAYGDSVDGQGEEESGDSALSGFVFADAYYNFDWNMPRQMDANGTQPHRAYVRTQGFALSFLGVEIAYTKEHYGATASLRFGPSAGPLIGQAEGGLGLDFVKQAYVSWMPTDKLTLDFGQFDTIYGAEVADSWTNVNYTRGALYFLMQPFWHTGLRVAYAASDTVGLNFLVVNGVNEPFDGDRAVDLGAQVVLTPSEALDVRLGYYGAQAKPDGMGWAHFFDLVATLVLDPVTLVFNGDLGVNDIAGSDEQSVYYGLSLAARTPLNSHWALGLRGEYLGEEVDDDAIDGAFTAFPGDCLMTGTFTIEHTPTDDGNLVFRLDTRIEHSPNVDQFYGVDSMTDSYLSSVLGVVVKSE